MMPNHILNELEFEQHISQLNDRGLIEFVARQQYHMSKLCPIHDKEIKALKKRSKKGMGISGGIGAFLGGIIVAISDYFLRR